MKLPDALLLKKIARSNLYLDKKSHETFVRRPDISRETKSVVINGLAESSLGAALCNAL